MDMSDAENDGVAAKSAAGAAQAQSTAPSTAPSGSIQVSHRQRGNPVLKSIRSAAWEFNESILPDYVMGANACAFFLSVRYHTLKPDYIHERLKKAKGLGFRLKVLLVLVDVKEPHHALKQLMRIAILADLTLVLAWSPEEAGKILETYKVFENKPPDMIMEKEESSIREQVVKALTTIRSVSSTDANTLLNVFDTLENVCKASVDEIALCPGFGQQKAERVVKTLTENFSSSTSG